MKYCTIFSTVLITVALLACGEVVGVPEKSPEKPKTMDTTMNKMRVEIWSDVMCPFCYIGKRKFEQALAAFPHKDKIAITWKSFELNPGLKTDPSKTLVDYLAENKGISRKEAQGMMDYAAGMAAKVGLEYHFEKAVVANSFNAHRFSHFAKQNGKQNEVEELLFHAYFTLGQNTDDMNVLLQIGADAGLDGAALKAAMNSSAYADDVKRDENEAQRLGINGVPFFLFDRKMAVSGAQDSQIFARALDQAYAAWSKAQGDTIITIADGKVCTPDGKCE